MVREKPIFVETHFRITPSQIHQNLYFYYHDPSKNYFHLKNTGASKGELEAVQTNLQYWIDQDDLFINNQKVQMIIQNSILEFQENNPIFPFIMFKILSQPYKFRKNLNEIHLYAKPEKLPYPAISCWKTQIGMIHSVESNSYSVTNDNKTHLTFYLAKGEIIGGDERIYIDVNMI
ncbi:MAG: hypothetical protein JSW11_18885 [Candidatus Heimdallarchaeota archaeon]|nr:MAG: hypothetical protein JSW11_18885 [Candidatus Heimdallarchaeota archaeon]